MVARAFRALKTPSPVDVLAALFGGKPGGFGG